MRVYIITIYTTDGFRKEGNWSERNNRTLRKIDINILEQDIYSVSNISLFFSKTCFYCFLILSSPSSSFYVATSISQPTPFPAQSIPKSYFTNPKRAHHQSTPKIPKYQGYYSCYCSQIQDIANVPLFSWIILTPKPP